MEWSARMEGSSGSKKERLLKLEKLYASIVATYQIIDKIDFRFLVHDKCWLTSISESGRINEVSSGSYFWPKAFYTAMFDV